MTLRRTQAVTLKSGETVNVLPREIPGLKAAGLLSKDTKARKPAKVTPRVDEKAAALKAIAKKKAEAAAEKEEAIQEAAEAKEKADAEKEAAEKAAKEKEEKDAGKTKEEKDPGGTKQVSGKANISTENVNK